MNIDLPATLAERLDAMFMEAMLGGPRPKQRATALRVRGRSFEVVELDNFGEIIEPPGRCCNGTVLHAPNCRIMCT